MKGWFDADRRWRRGVDRDRGWLVGSPSGRARLMAGAGPRAAVAAYEERARTKRARLISLRANS